LPVVSGLAAKASGVSARAAALVEALAMVPSPPCGDLFDYRTLVRCANQDRLGFAKGKIGDRRPELFSAVNDQKAPRANMIERG